MAIPKIKQTKFNLWLTIPLYTNKKFCNSDNDFLKEILIRSLILHIFKYTQFQYILWYKIAKKLPFYLS